MTIPVRLGLSALVVGADAYLLRAAPGDAWAAARSGRAAVGQLADSDAGAVEAALAATTLNGAGPGLWLVTLLALAAIWTLGRGSRTGNGALGLGLGIACLAGAPDRAEAYYDTKDYPEYVEILPNQTAFLIPEIGENKAGQAAFMSEAYLAEKKIPLKRIQILHTLIRNPGWAYDYYVPSARLLVVDRSPVSREWVTDSGRGTTARDQGFRFETADSITMSTGIVISAFVKEEDAARFVYWFGAKSDARADVTDPKVNFASVIYGKSLADVIDDNVHRTVQASIAKEFGRRRTDEAIRQKADVIEAVEKEVKRVFEPMGLTITTLGYAEGLTFENKDVQKAIDQTFMAIKNAQSAEAQNTTLPIQEKLLALEIRRMDAVSRAKLAERWNGSAAGVIPSALVVPGDILAMVKEWWQPAPAAPVQAPTAR